MSYNSLSFKNLLLGATLLPSLALASPMGNFDPRAVKTVDIPVAQITPNIISHGPLDESALERLKDALTRSIRPTSTPEPAKVKRQLNPTSTVKGSLTIATKDAFVSVDIGDINKIDPNSANCHSVEMNGPVDSMQVFMGQANIRAMNVTSSSGNTTQILSKLGDTATDAGVFTFQNGDRIKDFFVREASGTFLGFNFTTSSGAKYVASATSMPNALEMTQVPVGSGILARMRVQYCNNGLVGHVGFDFLNELQSVSISNIAYSGFTDDIMPAGAGTTMTVGSQIVDNRNSTAEQIITLQTTDAVTKSHTLSVANQWNVGGSTSVEAEAGIPFIGKTKVTTEFNWQVQKTTTEEDTEGETLTKSATINLKCPAKKYCVGSSFFTIFKMDVEVEATFRAKTKTGQDFFWTQKGKYDGADSLALQLQVDEADSVIGQRFIAARQPRF